MSTLVDRMRTCAAYIMGRLHDAPMPTEHLLDDAAALLVEASNILATSPAPLGEPMEIIPPKPIIERSIPPLPYQEGLAAAKERMLNPRACPRCDSRAAKTVRRRESRLMLECPACAHTWEYKP